MQRMVMIVVVLVVVLAGCGDNATKPTATFDGDACIYQGPSDFAQGEYPFVFANEAETKAGMAVWKIPDGMTTGEVEAAGGVFYVANPVMDIGGSERGIDPGNTVEVATLLDRPGTWLINCFVEDTVEGEGIDVGATVFTVTNN